MRWLAIDPALRNTGWAVMDRSHVYSVGLVETKRNPSLLVYVDTLRCLKIISMGLREAYNCDYREWPVYAEAKGGSKSARAAAAMAMAQGVLVGSLGCVAEITTMLPQEVKRRFCGNRSATKDDIKAGVIERYPGVVGMMVDKGITQKARQEHILDATAIGWAINQKVRETNNE